MRVAFTDMFLPIGDMVYGRTVANEQFISAIRDYGCADQYDFYYGDLAEYREFERRYSVDKFRCFPLSSFSKNAHLYSVFHRPDIQLGPWIQLRNQLDVSAVVTGQTHSLSYSRFWGDFLQMGVSNPSPNDGIWCTSRAAKTAVDGWFDATDDALGRICVRPDLRVFPLGCTPQMPCKKLGSYVLMINRFSPHSKVDLFPTLVALATSATRWQGVRWVIAGDAHDGDYADEILRWLHAHRIDWISIVKNPTEIQKSQLLREAAVFYSPSDNIQETFGITLIEAGAAEIPVVASDWNGYRDIVQDGVTGFLVPTEWRPFREDIAVEFAVMYERDFHFHLTQSVCVDIQYALDKILWLLRNPIAAQAMGQAARRHCESYFSWKTCIETLHAWWVELCDSQHVVPGSVPMPNPGLIFSHYPSRPVTDAYEWEMTDIGRAVVSHVSLPFYPEMEDHFPPEAVLYVLNRMATGISQPCLISILQKRFKLSPTTVNFLMTWMYKYQLISPRKLPEETAMAETNEN